MKPMIHVSEVLTTAPKQYKNELNQKIYEAFAALGIPFERVENDETLTMEDCVAIDERLKVKTAKTLFLCNRQKTNYYLYPTRADKLFVTKDFSKALGISRVSFASAEDLGRIIGVLPGASTILGVLMESAQDVKLIIDREVAEAEYLCCPDGTRTGYIKLRTSDVLEKLVPFSGHSYTVI